MCTDFNVDPDRAEQLNPIRVRAVREAWAAERLLANFKAAKSRDQKQAVFEHYKEHPGALLLLAQMRRAQADVDLDAPVDQLRREGMSEAQAHIYPDESPDED